MNHAGHVAVGDQPDRRAGRANLGHQILVPGTFQDADGDVAVLDAARLRQGAGVGPGAGDVDLGEGKA